MKRILTFLLVTSMLLSAIPFTASAASTGFTFKESFEDYVPANMPWNGANIPGEIFAKVSPLSTDGIGGDWSGAEQCSGSYTLGCYNPGDDGNTEYFQCLALSNDSRFTSGDATDNTDKLNLSYLLPIDASEGKVTATYRIKRRWPTSANYTISTLGVYVGGHATRTGRDKVKAVFKMDTYGNMVADGTIGAVQSETPLVAQAKNDGWNYFKTVCTKNTDGTWTIEGFNITEDGTNVELLNVRTEPDETIAGIGIVCPMDYTAGPWGPEVLVDDIVVKTTQSMGSITEVGYLGTGWSRCVIGRDVPVGSKTSYFGTEGYPYDATASFLHDVDITIPGTTFVKTNFPAWGTPGAVGNYNNSTLYALFQDGDGSPALTKGQTYQVNYRGLTYDYVYGGESVALTDSELTTEGNDFTGYTLHYKTYWRASTPDTGKAVMAAYKGGALVALSDFVELGADADEISRLWNDHELNLSVNVPTQSSVDEVKVFFFGSESNLKPQRQVEVLYSIQFPE